jgi:hypothetical protein
MQQNFFVFFFLYFIQTLDYNDSRVYIALLLRHKTFFVCLHIYFRNIFIAKAFRWCIVVNFVLNKLIGFLIMINKMKWKCCETAPTKLFYFSAALAYVQQRKLEKIQEWRRWRERKVQIRPSTFRSIEMWSRDFGNAVVWIYKIQPTK